MPFKDEDPDMERMEKEAARRERFREVFDAMALLADENQPRLDPEMIKNRIIPILQAAPRLIAGEMLPVAEEEEVETRKNLRNVDDITRQISAKLYPGLKDPSAAEFTRSDRHHTRQILKMVNKRSRVVEMALSNFYNTVQKVNAIFSGRGLSGHQL